MRSVNSLATLVFVIIAAIGAGLTYSIYGSSADWRSGWVLLITLIIAGIVSCAIKVASQWERAVVLRLGRFHGLRGALSH
jgi:hypothetical protein